MIMDEEVESVRQLDLASTRTVYRLSKYRIRYTERNLFAAA